MFADFLFSYGDVHINSLFRTKCNKPLISSILLIVHKSLLSNKELLFKTFVVTYIVVLFAYNLILQLSHDKIIDIRHEQQRKEDKGLGYLSCIYYPVRVLTTRNSLKFVWWNGNAKSGIETIHNLYATTCKVSVLQFDQTLFMKETW